MESVRTTLNRLILPLGKYRVVKVDRKFGGIEFLIDLGTAKMQVKLNVDANIEEGEWLTFYTEVLRAKPSEPPVQ